jgi:hypothetical protein
MQRIEKSGEQRGRPWRLGAPRVRTSSLSCKTSTKIAFCRIQNLTQTAAVSWRTEVGQAELPSSSPERHMHANLETNAVACAARQPLSRACSRMRAFRATALVVRPNPRVGPSKSSLLQCHGATGESTCVRTALRRGLRKCYMQFHPPQERLSPGKLCTAGSGLQANRYSRAGSTELWPA